MSDDVTVDEFDMAEEEALSAEDFVELTVPPKPTWKEKSPPVNEKADESEKTMAIYRVLNCAVNAFLHKEKTRDVWNFPIFPQTFHVLKESGEHLIHEEFEDGVVSIVPRQRAIDCIMQFCEFDCRMMPSFDKVFKKEASYILDKALSLMTGIKKPAMVLQKSEPGLTYHRLPFDVEDDPFFEKSPHFKEMMHRTHNWLPLMAWIGSLFDPLADRQQYVWLYGAGSNGKSTLGRFLSNVLGGAAKWYQTPGRNQNLGFWSYPLLGKRLVIFGDCNDYRFVTEGIFKSLTGGDDIAIEIKGGASFSAKIDTKCLFFSNNKPRIGSDVADQRRIIYCEMSARIGELDPDYESKLWAEAPYFLGSCIEQYRQVSGPRRTIPTDNSKALEIADENEEIFELFIEENFEITGQKSDVVTVNSMVRALENSRMARGLQKQIFYEYLKRKHGVEKIVKRTDGKIHKVFVNMRVNRNNSGIHLVPE